MMINSDMTREALEEIAIMECWMETAVVEAASKDELFEMICEWIEDGDECAGC